ncbi:uncharacterized protein EV422DRAFT_66693 [Fimicolochytrium jonesii]|uniref:uncharacterized protein n=1 Tax=Fimicolochytrium jonesii TaxID=1396493 RepID=UPI0022FE3570|nr:uncharacterized protein EV422DRAFT_66693 [Fimicolochytrium jonesii]KAI8820870.1 hypothetical protein EV422DRAFT_66693 [Fimicolochytrium jonesii]
MAPPVPRVKSAAIYVLTDSSSTYVAVPASASGRRADELGIFLEIISGGAIHLSSDIFLTLKRTGEVVAALTSDAIVYGGVYTLTATSPVHFVYPSETPRLFPPSRKGTPTASLTTSRPGSPRDTLLVNAQDVQYVNINLDTPVIESVSVRNCSGWGKGLAKLGRVYPALCSHTVLNRDIRSRENIIQRDRYCVVTGTTNLNSLRGCHIIPFAWKKNQVVGSLPPAVRDHILENLGAAGIDDVRNGFLATRDLHDAFDRGEWAVANLDGRPCFFGISPEYHASDHHRQPLRLPDGAFPDGEPLVDYFPDPILWQHHFQCAVFRHMRGGGEIDDDQRDPDVDPDELRQTVLDMEAELESIDAELGHLEEVGLGEAVRKLRADVAKEYYGRVDTYGVPANIPAAYL